MKKKTSTTLKIGWAFSLAAAIIAIPLVAAMCIPPISVSTFIFALVFLACLPAVGFAADHFSPARITLSDAEVQLRVRRTGETIVLPWTDFACLYELEGWKRKFYLLTPAPMDKEAQLAAYKACCENKGVPYTHEGCLMLNAYVHGNVIDQYLPAHIQKMPWRHCAKL